MNLVDFVRIWVLVLVWDVFGAAGQTAKCFRKLDEGIGRDSYALVRIILRKHAMSLADNVGENAGQSVLMLMNYNGRTRVNPNHFSETIANAVRSSFVQSFQNQVIPGLKKSSRVMSQSTLDWLCDSRDPCCFMP